MSTRCLCCAPCCMEILPGEAGWKKTHQMLKWGWGQLFINCSWMNMGWTSIYRPFWSFLGFIRCQGFWPIAQQKYGHRWRIWPTILSHSQRDGKDWTSKSHEIPVHLMIYVLASTILILDYLRRFPKMFWYPKTVGFNAKKKVSWLGWFGGTPETIGNPLAIFIFDETDLSDLYRFVDCQGCYQYGQYG